MRQENLVLSLAPELPQREQAINRVTKHSHYSDSHAFVLV